MAKNNPKSLVIGIDPCHQNLIELSAKALKKSSKGGLKNLLYVLANVDELPDELSGIADIIYVNFPWGSLLQGIVLGRETTWNNIKKVAKKDANIQIIFGYDKAFEEREVERLQLPELTPLFINEVLVPNLMNFGFDVQIKALSSHELSGYPTTWAHTLRFGQKRTYYRLLLN